MSDATIYLSYSIDPFEVSYIDRDWRPKQPERRRWYPGRAPFLWYNEHTSFVYAGEADMHDQYARKKKEGIIT